MAENTDTSPPRDTSEATSAPATPRQTRGGKKRGVGSVSPRRIDDLFEWIEEAQNSHRTWARNALVVILAIVALLLVALRTGLLRP